MSQENQQNQQQDSQKDEKKYQNALRFLTGVLGEKGTPLLKKKKASVDTIDKVVEDLLKEENEEFEKTFKVEVRDLIKKHIAVQDEISKKEKELEQAKSKIKKEFTEAAGKLSQKVADRQALEQRFKSSLTEVDEAGSTTETTEV